MNIDELWTNVLNHCGDVFYTKTGLPFTYKRVDSLRVKVNRDGRYVGYIKRQDMKFILENPYARTSEYVKVMRVSAYATALYREFVENN